MAYLTGFHAIEEYILSGAQTGALLLAKAGPRAKEIVALAGEHKILVSRVGTHDLERISHLHRGIALEIPDVAAGSEIKLDEFIEALGDKKNVLAVMLDEVTDPHNYGAIIRSCDQAGVDVVITRNKRTAKHADTIAKTSAGAAAWVRQAETPNLPRACEQLKNAGFWIYGADSRGECVYKQKLTGRICLVLGGEGTGITRLLGECCDGFVAIPSVGRVDSFNVSVAAGILLYELLRQRSQNGK
ncbi:23S rRNA (guanosine(2251)-2'-O)-methyltransferase RlmB [Spirochaetia bacterium]|nr:23S rRNA (guanosine(2251)-2'-O)-methyltransferase RlmB [Spirochaetia bacterium]